MDHTRRVQLGYLAMLAGTVVLYLAIRQVGEGLPAPIAPAVEPTRAVVSSAFGPVLLSLAVVTACAQGMGWFFRRVLGQPPVMGEILAGILLGPSVLGALAPEVGAVVLPSSAAPFLGMVANVGVVLFMFVVGLELDTKQLRSLGHSTLAISHASIVAPFLLGSILALGLYQPYAPAGVSFTAFSLFVGVSLSVTAFPVLARILTDRGLQRTRLGSLALACAAVDDVSAWTLLAFVAAVARAQTSGLWWTLGAIALYLAGMFAIVRPLIVRFARFEGRREGPFPRSVLAAVCVALLLSALATEAIGIHALFGAFLLGALIPHEGRLAEEVRSRIEDLVVVLLLPAFFAFTGLRTRIGLLDAPIDALFAVGVVAVATLGKFGGSYLAARATGMNQRDAGAIGILMNTRGLMELIVLNVGLDLGVISPRLFAMLVVMALVTTFSTTPILDRIIGRHGFGAAPSPAA